MPPSLEAIKNARERIRSAVHATPLLSSTTFSHLTGGEIFFKCENLQKVGAFKARGACNALFQLSSEELAHGVVTESSGNHAQAVAYAASLVGTKARIVMPKTSPQSKVAGVRGYGGEITFSEPNEADRKAVCLKIKGETGAQLVHPFEDDRVIAGQGTIALEILEQLPSVDVILCPIGGGGLISGISTAVKALKPSVKIIGVEPEGAADVVLSRKNGVRTPVPGGGKSISEGLLATVGENPFHIIQRFVDEVVTVSDEEIISAMKLLWERSKLIVEASGATAVSAALQKKIDVSGKRCAIVLTGGNVDLDSLPWIRTKQ